MQEVKGKVSNKGGNLLLESTLWDYSGMASKCYPHVITEKISIWIENEAVIIWSCKEMENGIDHDEAVIILKTTTFYSLDNGVPAAVAKFLANSPLLKTIKFEYCSCRTNYGEGLLNRFPCKDDLLNALDDKKHYWKTLIVVIVISIMIIGCAISTWCD